MHVTFYVSSGDFVKYSDDSKPRQYIMKEYMRIILLQKLIHIEVWIEWKVSSRFHSCQLSIGVFRLETHKVMEAHNDQKPYTKF